MKAFNTPLLCSITLLMKFGCATDYVTSMELEAPTTMVFNMDEDSRRYSEHFMKSDSFK